MRYLLFFLPALLLAAQTPAAHRKAPANKALAAVTVAKNFKESGSPTAPIRMEIYTDYECPACRDLYMNILPPLTADFVATGKVQILHRDFRIPSHQFSKVATRYANAAGMIGKFDIVVNQLFVTQPEWAQTGNVDGTVAKVLSPADMEKVRAIVKGDSHLDDSVVKDEAMATNVDHLQETPTLVIISKGKRETITRVPYAVLKQYLNQKLAQ